MRLSSTDAHGWAISHADRERSEDPLNLARSVAIGGVIGTVLWAGLIAVAVS